MEKRKKILVTGAAGFIGANFVKTICLKPEVMEFFDFVLLDALTYAGNYDHIAKEVEKFKHLTFVNENIRNTGKIEQLFERQHFDGVINFAAESHVDNSIESPSIFVETNVGGTLNLLKASLQSFKQQGTFRYLQVSTDEVYGELTLDEPPFSEQSPIKPNSPYSASKAGADHLVQAFSHTYRLPAIITRCSNNYGPYQHAEKYIPKMIALAKQNKPLNIYGKGENIRDWIHVEDHVQGIWQAFQYNLPQSHEVFNFGGNCELTNLTLAKKILHLTKRGEHLLHFVPDRLGHDFRYAIDYSKATKLLGWVPEKNFSEEIKRLI